MRKRGRRIRTIDELLRLSAKGGAVWVATWGRHSPIAFMISMQVRCLNAFVKRGIYEYTGSSK